MPEDEKIKRLPVSFKEPVLGEKFLVVGYQKCFHNSFVVDDSVAEVTCKACGEKLNPMWVLRKLAHEETKFHEAAKRYSDEMKRLKERSKTKCRKCGSMTEISRN